MKKHFCNSCGVELNGHNTFDAAELIVSVESVDFGIAQLNTDTDYDVCKYCVIDAITKLDDRPKSTSK